MSRVHRLLVAFLAIGVWAINSSGQVVVGSDDFESYFAGQWVDVEANPTTWINGDNPSAILANIVDVGETNLELQIDFNLQNMWQVGLNFEMGCSNNVSQDIGDYSMEFYLRVSPASVTYLTSADFIMNIRNPDATSQGSAYNIATYDPGYTNAQSGVVLTIPLGAGGLSSGATAPMDGSLTNWQVEFRFDSNKSSSDQPINIAIDDIVVTYTEPPFLNPTLSPTGLTTNDPTVSAAVHDGTKEVDFMQLFLDGGLVASNSYAGGSTTNTISYDWIGAPGGTHTGVVVAVAADAYAETNSWTFLIPVEAPSPATNILKLYSFNFAGYFDPDPVDELPYLNDDYVHAVSNGVVGAAPSLGSNIWNNLLFDNAWWIWNPWNHTLVDANGDTNSPCWFRISDTNAVGAYLNMPWTWNGEFNNFLNNTYTANTMWPVWMGDTTTSLDFQLDGLDPAQTYDLYMYFTSPLSGNTNTTTYTVVQGIAPAPVATLVSSWDPLLVGDEASPSNYVEGVNYAVITGVAPTQGGRISVNVSGNNKAGVAAMQIAMRDDGGSTGPTVDPNVQSIEWAGGMVTLMFDSESNVLYSVLSKTRLEDESWNAVTNGIPGTGATTSASVPASADQAFYQVMGE